MFNGKNRAYLIGIVGAYLIYIAYQLYQGRSDPDTTMTPAVMILFIVFFVLAGAGLLVYAVRVWRTADREQKENQKPPEDGQQNLK